MQERRATPCPTVRCTAIGEWIDAPSGMCNDEFALHTARRGKAIMTRIQILLSDEQDRRLKALARRLGASKSTLVREGVESVLRRREAGVSDALLELVGQAGRVGRKDVSRRHDAYLGGAKRKRAR